MGFRVRVNFLSLETVPDPCMQHYPPSCSSGSELSRLDCFFLTLGLSATGLSLWQQVQVFLPNRGISKVNGGVAAACQNSVSVS